MPAIPDSPPRAELRQRVELYSGKHVDARALGMVSFALRSGELPLSMHPAWLTVLRKGLKHEPFLIEVHEGPEPRGFLPLSLVTSRLFGRFLVSLPYLNYGGCQATDASVSRAMVDRAVALAEELRVRYLELRHEAPVEHASLNEQVSTKVHMRLLLPETPGKLWDQLSGKVRNLVRKGQKHSLQVVWGGHDLLGEFYTVFSKNMRDLGTPVYGKRLFRAILDQFPGRAEICVVRSGAQPVGGALLLHGWGISEVPSASTLREFNSTSANMLMYWHLLERAVQRGQQVFDFGRSSIESNTFRFKKQWGAEPHGASWQYFLRIGQANQMRPDNPSYGKFIRVWQKLPVWVTRLIGPTIVRGIP
jgi:FemAB-related protein (PEP-CTERM system-associated)